MKSFRHIEKNCKSTQKCGKFSGNHGEDECNASKDNYKCVNCESSHSSFYIGCHGFREAKNLLLLNKDKQTTASNDKINQDSINIPNTGWGLSYETFRKNYIKLVF